MFWQTIVILFICTVGIFGKPPVCTPNIPTVSVYCDQAFNISWTTADIFNSSYVNIYLDDYNIPYYFISVQVGIDGVGNSYIVIPCSLMDMEGVIVTDPLMISYNIYDSQNTLITSCQIQINKTITSCGNRQLETIEQCDNSIITEANCNTVTCLCNTNSTGNGTCSQTPTLPSTQAPIKSEKIVLIVIQSIVIIIAFILIIMCASIKKNKCDNVEFESEYTKII